VYSWQEFESSRPSKNDGVERERFSLQDETLFQADLVVKMKHCASYGCHLLNPLLQVLDNALRGF
jgi:hypothetical protein